MDLSTFIIDFFTTREWASITLIALFVLFSARAKSVRGSMLGVVKAFFHWKILLPIICAQLYLSIFACVLYKYNLWNTTILRETIFFLFYTSIALILKYNNNDERITSIKGIVEDTVKATLIIEFYLNIQTTAPDIPRAVSVFFERPRKGQQPRKRFRTKLFTRTAPTIITR